MSIQATSSIRRLPVAGINQEPQDLYKLVESKNPLQDLQTLEKRGFHLENTLNQQSEEKTKNVFSVVMEKLFDHLDSDEKFDFSKHLVERYTGPLTEEIHYRFDEEVEDIIDLDSWKLKDGAHEIKRKVNLLKELYKKGFDKSSCVPHSLTPTAYLFIGFREAVGKLFECLDKIDYSAPNVVEKVLGAFKYVYHYNNKEA